MIVDLNTFSSFLTPQAFAVGIMWNASSVMALIKWALILFPHLLA